MGAGVMGLGYWCFAANVFLTVFQSRLVRVRSPTGTSGSSSPPARGADRRDGAGRDPGAAGERRLALPGGPRGRMDRPDQPRAHQPRHRADDARRRGAVLRSLRASAARRLARRAANRCFWLLLAGSLAFYGVALYLGLPRGTARRRSRADSGAGGGGDAAAPVPDHGRRDRDVGGVLAPARDCSCARSAARARCAVRARRLRRARASARSRARSRRSRP